MSRAMEMCPRCNGPTAYRSRETIANVLVGSVQHCAFENADWTRRFLDLMERLVWIEDELRGVCVSCTQQRLQQSKEPLPDNVRSIR